ncbi:MAG: glycosyltransferase family 4 protein [bacterium]|nr:glycosyltransferase family 4 protein [bacterium]
MKIGIYDPYLDDLGGGEKYMLSLAECLSKRHQVTLFWDKKEDFKRVEERFTLDLSRVFLAPNIFSPGAGFFKKIRETKKLDAIIFLSDGSIPFSLSKKLFLHIQQPISGIKANPKIRWKLSRVTRVFCNSYYSKSYIDRALGVESLVLYPPVKIGAKPLQKENIILHVGRFRVRDPMIGINDYKKQSVMVSVFKEMVENGLKDWKFVLAVSVREEEKDLFNKFQKEADGFPIEFTINKTNEELWEIYSRAKIYWHASGFGEDLVKHPEYAEHFGISTVEAMGAGCVPVVINAGGQKEIVQDGVNGLLWETLDELKMKTLGLIQDKNIREKLSKAAKKRAKFFSGDRFCQEITTLIEN